MTETERINAFLAELNILTRKHGIAIGGCGDCGSPYLIDIIANATEDEDRKRYGMLDPPDEHLSWDTPEELERWGAPKTT